MQPQTDLIAEVNDCTKQHERIMFIFRHKPNPLTPWQVLNTYQAWFGYGLIGSIRRGITNLTKSGQLSQTGEKVKGPYRNAPNGLWQIN